MKKFSTPDLAKLRTEAAVHPGKAAQKPAGPAKGPNPGEKGRLMSLPGVVMVGDGQDEIGRPAFIVGVRDASFLPAVPETAAGRRVMKRVIGDIDAYKQQL